MGFLAKYLRGHPNREKSPEQSVLEHASGHAPQARWSRHLILGGGQQLTKQHGYRETAYPLHDLMPRLSPAERARFVARTGK